VLGKAAPARRWAAPLQRSAPLAARAIKAVFNGVACRGLVFLRGVYSLQHNSYYR